MTSCQKQNLSPISKAWPVLKHIAVTTLLAFFIISAIPALCTLAVGTADPVHTESFTFHKVGNTLVATAYTGSGKAAEIPAEVDGVPVSTIGYFTDASGLLEEITLPETVHFVSRDSLQHCPALQRIHVADGNPALTEANGLLLSADGKTLLLCPPGRTGEVIVPEGVETIASQAFMNSRVSHVMLPESLRSIQSCAFTYCPALEVLDIPASVTMIDPNAFIVLNASAAPIRLIVTEGSIGHIHAKIADLPIEELRVPADASESHQPETPAMV